MRNKQIDTLRGIGICFVVLGHTQNLLTGWIFTFHMPLFFFLTGFLRRGSREKPWPELVRGKARGILVPYAVFWALSLVQSALARILAGGTPSPIGWPQLQALLLGGGYLDTATNNFPIWYLQLLFIATLAFEAVLWLRTAKALAAAGILLALVTVPFQTLLPGRPAFHINILPAALVFMLLGYWFRGLTERQPRLLRLPWLTGPVLLVLGALLSLPYDANVSEIRRLAYFPGALFSILGWYLLSHPLSVLSPLAWLGRNSLYILGLHSLFWEPSYSLGGKLCAALSIGSSTLQVFCVVTICMGFSAAAAALWLGLRRLLPHK